MERGAGGSRRACVNLRDLRWPALAVVLAVALAFTACAQGRDGGTTGTPPIESLRLLYAYDRPSRPNPSRRGPPWRIVLKLAAVPKPTASSGRLTESLVLPAGKG